MSFYLLNLKVHMTISKQARFSQKTLDFLVKAGRQKKPDWLEKNADDYEKHVRAPFVELAQKIKAALQLSAPDYHFPSKGLARLKRPDFKVAGGQNQFKDWLSMIPTRPSRSQFESNPHLFFGLFPNEDAKILIAGGLWQPTSKQTRLIREAIYKDAVPFHELFEDESFKARFKKGFKMEHTSVRIPRGFSADHQDIDWIKLNRFVVMKEMSIKDFSSPNFSNSVIKDFKQALRLNQLLERALSLNWPSR